MTSLVTMGLPGSARGVAAAPSRRDARVYAERLQEKASSPSLPVAFDRLPRLPGTLSLKNLSKKPTSGGPAAAKTSVPKSVPTPKPAPAKPVAAKTASVKTTSQAKPASSKASTSYTLLGSPFPLRPAFNRTTVINTVVQGRMWTLEQQQGLGFSNVTINTRMTVIKLSSGGLWVHAPIAPTRECLDMVRSLGEVEHIVLPTFAIEHKVFFGPFSRRFPDAQLWVAPGQWSFPLNLPLSFLGLGFRKVTELRDDMTADECPWRKDVDFKVNLNDSFSDIGPYCEVAFYHTSTKTLLVTDCVVQVPREPLDLVDPELLLSAAVENPFNPFSRPPPDSPEARQLGWRRIVTQVLFFGPSDLANPNATFEKLCEPQVICSPVVRTLVFSKCPDDTLDWAESIAREWKFDKIIACHFKGPFKCDAKTFLDAFKFCYDATGRKPPAMGLGAILPFGGSGSRAVDFDRDTPDDMKILQGLNSLLIKVGAVDN